MTEIPTTAKLLLSQYGGRPIISVDDVCRDYFAHLTPEKFMRKVGLGDIALPVMRVEASQKCYKGVHIQDLADYLDQRREAARKELRQITRS